MVSPGVPRNADCSKPGKRTVGQPSRIPKGDVAVRFSTPLPPPSASSVVEIEFAIEGAGGWVIASQARQENFSRTCCALPHRKCYRRSCADDWGGVTESGRWRRWRMDQHGRAARGGMGGGAALRGGRTAREGAHPGRTDGDDGLASQTRGTGVVGVVASRTGRLQPCEETLRTVDGTAQPPTGHRRKYAGARDALIAL